MIKTVRAAGFAAAAFLVAAVAGWGGPLQAGQNPVAPSTSSYFDHMAADSGVSDLGLNAPATETGAPAAEFAESRYVQLANHLVGLADAVLPRPRALPELVEAYAGYDTDSRQQDCLASAVYFEARGEPIEGQLAVARVVINRASPGLYPSDYCSVVTQRKQFSFVRNGRIPRANESSDEWRRAKAVAQIAHQDLWDSAADDALYFHATYVRPGWASQKTQLARIDTHIFYR